MGLFVKTIIILELFVLFVFSCSTTGQGRVGSNEVGSSRQSLRKDRSQIQNGKVLYDFGDIDCWSKGEMNYYIYNNDTVPFRHPDHDGDEMHHTNSTNCTRKGYAAWSMFMVLSGASYEAAEKSIEIKASVNRDIRYFDLLGREIKRDNIVDGLYIEQSNGKRVIKAK